MKHSCPGAGGSFQGVAFGPFFKRRRAGRAAAGGTAAAVAVATAETCWRQYERAGSFACPLLRERRNVCAKLGCATHLVCGTPYAARSLATLTGPS